MNVMTDGVQFPHCAACCQKQMGQVKECECFRRSNNIRRADKCSSTELIGARVGLLCFWPRRRGGCCRANESNCQHWNDTIEPFWAAESPFDTPTMHLDERLPNITMRHPIHKNRKRQRTIVLFGANCFLLLWFLRRILSSRPERRLCCPSGTLIETVEI
jgi:hypothetical protein